MAKKVCDFCLEEYGGLFSGVQQLDDGHLICRKCRKKLEDYGLPIKYDLFQLAIIAEPSMREMILSDYLEHHSPDDAIAKYFPLTNMLVHEGEHVVNVRDASITVDPSLIPSGKAVQRICDISRRDISDLFDQKNGTSVQGKLYETDAALYFLSEHFINVHRLTNMVRDHQDHNAIHVLEHGHEYTYTTPHTDLFYLRDLFHTLAVNRKADRKQNLIYLSSENTMTLTPGIYRVPKNVKPGTYWASPVDAAGMSIRDANGHVKNVSRGKVHLDEGSTLEVTGEYQLRIKQRDPETHQ